MSDDTSFFAFKSLFRTHFADKQVIPVRGVNTIKRNKHMDATLQSDLQAVADKDQVTFSVTITTPPVPVEPTTETVDFIPTAPAQ